jgi:serine/threonine protein kinase/predicted Zn-dependent protease
MTVTCPRCQKGVELPDRPTVGARCPECQMLLAPADETVALALDETDDVANESDRGKAERPAASSRPAADDELEALPRRLANYELLEVIGRGGMGVVYRARHIALDRFVALKLIRRIAPSRDDALRFVAEAQVTGQIEHPNIVPVHEVGTDEQGRPFFVMKLVRGRSLADILLAIQRHDAKTLREYPLVRLLSVFCDVCQAVAFAHAKGILHRDLKPSNVMVGDFGEVLVMDWGLTKKFGAPETQSAGLVSFVPGQPPSRVRADGDEVRTVRDLRRDTNPRFVAGTPEYMAPEQAMGDPAALSPRADVYSLGAVLFETLTFRPPHVDPDTSRLIQKVATEHVVFPKPGRTRPRVAKALRAIAMKALSLEPSERYPGALALLEDVRAFLEDRSVSACPDTVFDRAARVLRRHGPLLGTIAAALIIISAGSAVAFWRLQAAEADRALSAENEIRERRLREAKEDERRVAVEHAQTEEQARTEEERKRREAERAHDDQVTNLARAIPLYLNALEMLKRRQYDTALGQLERVIEIDPFSPTARLAYLASGEVCERKGDPTSARAAIRNYEAADKLARQINRRGDPRALLRCGEVSWRLLQDRTEALRYYEAAAALDPESPHALLGRAYALILRGREDKDPAAAREKARAALDLALQVTAKGDFLWEAHYVAGSLYGGLELPASGLRDLPKAQQHFSQALTLEPGSADCWAGRAAVARGMGETAAALADYQTAIRLRPDSVPALQGRGELLLEGGRGAEALEDLEHALKLAPELYALRLSRAEALLQLKKWPDAEAALTEALNLHPDDARAVALRGRARMAQGRYSDAAGDFDRAALLDPQDIPSLQLRAEARLKAALYPAAEQDYRKLLERAPSVSEGWRGLGDALRAQGRLKEALAAYETFLQQQPGQLEVRLDVARMRYADAAAAWYDPNAALQHARQAERTAQGDNPRVMKVLAEALLAAGKPDEAIQEIERAYTRFPTDPEIQAARERLRQARPKTPPKR